MTVLPGEFISSVIARFVIDIRNLSNKFVDTFYISNCGNPEAVKRIKIDALVKDT